MGDSPALITAVVGAAAAAGAGFRWFLSWLREGSASRSAKLDGWHKELTEREQRIAASENEFQERIERRLKAVEAENVALRQAFTLLSATVRHLDPGNAALAQAELILAAAFPLEPGIPETMGQQLAEISRRAKRGKRTE